MLNLSVHLQLLSLIWRGEGDDIWRCLGQEEAEVALKGCVPCVSPWGGAAGGMSLAGKTEDNTS